MQLSLQTDRTLLRASARSTRYLLVSLKAPDAALRAGRLPVSVGLVLDRSGSMDGEGKFGLAREAVEQSLRLLRPDDRFTLVVYDDEVSVLAPATLATHEAKARVLDRLRAVGPRGATDLDAGWTSGADELALRLTEEAVNRVLLLTDGLANTGVVEPALLTAKAAELRRRGIATSTFGVGADFDERLLRDLAHEGGGNFYYIETPRQIPDLVTSELGEALEIVARDAVLHLELPEGADAEPLNRNRFTRTDGGRALRVELGDLTSGQELRLVLRIRFAEGEKHSVASVRVRLAERDVRRIRVAQTCEWRYASHAANDVQPRDAVVDRETARLYAARARAEATEANRRDDLRHARRVLEQTARRIRSYAGRDAELEAVWRALQEDVQNFGERAMNPMQLKSALFASESVSKNRSPDGKARRRARRAAE
jgi:Ca-activated chloride channel family protein